MDKYIGFDIDSKKTVPCVVQKGEKDKYTRFRTDIEQQAGGKLLMSIPGVGPRTAEAVLAYTDDVNRFARGKQYCAYFNFDAEAR